jgi:hypothetical protein
MQIDRPGRDSERGPAKQFTGNVWTDVIAAPSQSSPAAVYSVHGHGPPAAEVTSLTMPGSPSLRRPASVPLLSS